MIRFTTYQNEEYYSLQKQKGIVRMIELNSYIKQHSSDINKSLLST